MIMVLAYYTLPLHWSMQHNRYKKFNTHIFISCLIWYRQVRVKSSESEYGPDGKEAYGCFDDSNPVKETNEETRNY